MNSSCIKTLSLLTSDSNLLVFCVVRCATVYSSPRTRTISTETCQSSHSPLSRNFTPALQEPSNGLERFDIDRTILVRRNLQPVHSHLGYRHASVDRHGRAQGSNDAKTGGYHWT